MRVLGLTIFACAIWFLLPQSVTAGEYDDIRIISQNSSGVIFSYRVGPVVWVSEPEGDYPRLERTALSRLPDYPPVPGRIAYVALPPGCPGVNLELLSVGEPNEGSHLLASQLTGPAVAFPYPAEMAQVDRVFTIRGLRLARLLLHPLIFESADGRYSLASEMTVRVSFLSASGRSPLPVGAASEDAFTPIFREILLNPGQAASWRTRDDLGLAKALADSDPFAGADRWLAIHVRTGGVVRVIPADLNQAGADLSAVNPAAFRLFAGPGRSLSTQMSDPPPQLTEVPIVIRGGDDGSFDGTDELEFYAVGLNRWEMAADGKLVDVVDRYEQDNVYWLALDGSFTGTPKRLAAVSAAPFPAPAPVWFSARSRARHERDQIFRVDNLGDVASYYTWYWQNARSSVLLPYAATESDTGAPARWEIGAYANQATLTAGGARLQRDTVLPNAGEDASTISVFDVPAFDPAARFALVFDSSGSGNYYLDYYSIDYRRRLDLSAGPFPFAAPDTDAAFTLVLSDTAMPSVWDVTDPAGPVALAGLTQEGGAARFGVDQSDRSRHVFYAFESAQRRRPSQVRMIARSDLHQPSMAAGYLVIGPRSFQSAIAPFMSFRSARSGLTVRFVAIEDIYDAFSLGLTDPLAIRRFLRHAFLSWPRPAPVYTLLLGDGTYDFLDNGGAHSVNYVPPYIGPDDNSAADENYAYFGDKQVLNSDGDQSANPFPDMIIGRWPVKSAAEIQTIAAKITGYESPDNLGPWRSRVMMVADDEFGDRTRGSVDEDFHVRDAESIAQKHIPSRWDVQKVYLTEYPFNNPGCEMPAARGCRKPAVNEAIVSGLNNGVLVFDYLGHGNKDLLAHEHVFERTVDLPRLANAGMPAAFLTFSCSIGFFDDPASEGMSEDLMRMPDAGAVAVVSATRLVTAGANAALNEKVFDLLFGQNMTGIGTALYTGKVLRQYFANCTSCDQPPCPCPNDRRYILFGDPAMTLGIPDLRVDFSSVQPETLSALTLTNVEGRIVDTAGSPQSAFDGTLTITVRDAPRHRIHRISDNLSVEYDLAGGTMYRGNVTVTAGRFGFGFMVPKDIAYGERGALILGHAASATHMAGGVTDSLWIAGSSTGLADTSGPDIQLETIDGRVIADGSTLPTATEIIVVFADTSGINLTAAPGHSIEAFLDNSDQPFADLTSLFTYAPGEFRRGTTPLSLASVSVGTHHLQIKAWDNANNSAEKNFEIEIADQPQFHVREFLNYPNPFSGRTTFYFRPSVEDATIRIFTLTGRMIRSIDPARDGEASWDGTDQSGDPVGNGVYLAQIELNGRVVQGDKVVDKRAYKETKVVVSR